MEKRLTMFLASLLLCFVTAMAQTKVTGTVVSQEDGQPIIGATVQIVGTNKGVVTDFEGKFTVTPPAGKKTLLISYVGMESKEVQARDGMRVELKSEASQLDEVMVVAFGTAKKSAFTGSAKVVGSEELAMSQVTSVTSALQGAVAGVQLTSNNGQPGESSTIRIRGFGSINAGQDPLIILDGAPYSGDIANINPADVESMTVLKDAASNALYGARGANGVIIITTKNGKKDRPATINVDMKYGANTRALQHYDVVKDPAAYYEMQYGALNRYYKTEKGMDDNAAWQAANAALIGKTGNGGLGYNIWSYPEGQMLIGQNGKLNPNATLGRVVEYGGESYLWTPDDWEDEATRTGVRQEYNISVNGASEKSTYYLSLGYLGNEGVAQKSDYERFSARLRTDYQVRDWMKVGASMAYTRFDANQFSNNGTETSSGNIWAFTYQIAPIYPIWVRNGDGSIKVDSNGIKMMDYGNGMNAGGSRLFITDANPIQDSRLNKYNREGNALSGNVFADINLFKGLTFTINGAFNLDETRWNLVYNPYYGQFDSTGGTVNMEHDRYYNFNVQQLLNYSTTIAEHNNVTALVGHEYYKSTSKSLYASKSKMFSQANTELNGAIVDGQDAGSYSLGYNIEGWFGRLQYDYDNRIFASASLRADASSRFAKDHWWGRFWSVGAAWLINKEKWFNASWVNQLKVKASFGQQGNDNIGNFLYTDCFDILNSSGSIGTAFFRKGTEDITWETNTNLNLGLEFALFNNKLTGSIEYFNRKTSDMLFSFSVAPSNGYSFYYDNVGDLVNRGVELDLNYNIIHSKNVDWDIRANISSLHNEITMLHPDKQNAYYFDKDGKEYLGYASGDFFMTEGNSMYSWRLKEYAGLDDKGQSLWWKNKYQQVQSKDATTGELLWQKDDNGDFKLDEAGNKIAIMEDYVDPVTKRKVFEGREKTDKWSEADYYVNNESTIPKFMGGFGTTVKAFGFDLSVNCSFSLGGKAYDSTYQTFMFSPTGSTSGFNFHKDLYDAWTETNTNTNIPRMQYGDNYSNGSSDRFLTSANYLNIENINFGYTLPKSLTRKFQVENLRFYVSAENVCYFSARKGFDPRASFSDNGEAYGGRSNATTYSPIRTISGGISVTF